MAEIRKIDDRGRVTLPAKFMKELRLKPGDTVQVMAGLDHIAIFRVTDAHLTWARRARHG